MVRDLVGHMADDLRPHSLFSAGVYPVGDLEVEAGRGDALVPPVNGVQAHLDIGYRLEECLALLFAPDRSSLK